MRLKKICFLAGIYPTKDKPNSAVFYKELIHQFAKNGIECKVIHPYPINRRINKADYKRIDKVDDSINVEVYRPKTLTFGAKNLGPIKTARFTLKCYIQSAKRVLHDIDWQPDAFYGHFISPAGAMAAALAKEFNVPSYIAYGESTPWSIKSLGVKKTSDLLKSVNGFISVSTKNKNDLVNLGITTRDKIRVFPNAVDNNVFYKRNKLKAREKLGWEKDKLIIAYTGHYNNRKGILRLDEAIKDIPNVYVAYAGSGELIPSSSNIIHTGNVAPELMPWFLSASDIFVLPTLNEGSCNAIVEAMACGLPIVSSDREFNYDLLSKENSILIDPTNINEISKAIKMIINNTELKYELEKKSLETVKMLNIEDRVKTIISWMKQNYS